MKDFGKCWVGRWLQVGFGVGDRKDYLTKGAMAISDRLSLIIMGAITAGSIGAILMTSNARKLHKAQNKSFGLENLEEFRRKS